MELKALRGAIDFLSDTKAEIEQKTEELFRAIIEKNELDLKKVVCILFSLTPDIKSEYPAKVFREKFSSEVPLFSSLEPDIEGGMSLTLRVLVLHYGEHNVPVYLNKAQNLRKDLIK